MDVLSCYLGQHEPKFDVKTNNRDFSLVESYGVNELDWQLSVVNESFDIIGISSELLNHIKTPNNVPNVAYFMNWLRLLKPGGSLYLAQNYYLTFDELSICSLLIESTTIENGILVITKKSQLDSLFSNLEILTAQAYFKEWRKQYDLALAYYLLIRAFDENYIISTLVMTFFLLRQQKSYLINELWHQLCLKYPTITNNVFHGVTLLNTNQYHKGFSVRENAFSELPNERRSECPPKAEFLAKHWAGENLKGKKFVVWSEFGLGDEIMFSQLAYFFKHYLHVEKLTFVVQKPIAELLASHPDIDEIIIDSDANEKLVDFDYWEWPHALLAHIPKPEFAEIPKRHPYLFAQPKKMLIFQKQLKQTKNLKVGIAWRGDPKHENDLHRSIHDIHLLTPLLEVPNIDWYCLQKDLNEQELTWLEKHQISFFSDQLKDFSDTAALASQMDLIISVDTSVVHLAGALNIPTFLMLPIIYDWRWGMYNEQNLWYPSIRSFFTDFPDFSNTMGQVVPKVKSALEDYIAERLDHM